MNLIKEYIRTLLSEAPIGDFDVIGRPIKTDKPGSFDKQDRKLLSNPKAIEKIKRKWEKTPYNFNMYLLNVPQLNKSNFRERGVIERNSEFSQLFEKFAGMKLPEDPGSITILFNGNSGADKVPLTAWTMAHRFGHAIQSSNMITSWNEYIMEAVELTKRILDEVYDKTINFLTKRGLIDSGFGTLTREKRRTYTRMLSLIFGQLGSFKSAREGKITRYYEFFYELFAQYLMTGKITFQPLNKQMIIGNLPFGRKEMVNAVDDDIVDMWNRDMEIYADQIESRIINVLEDCVGETFLM